MLNLVDLKKLAISTLPVSSRRGAWRGRPRRPVSSVTVHSLAHQQAGVSKRGCRGRAMCRVGRSFQLPRFLGLGSFRIDTTVITSVCFPVNTCRETPNNRFQIERGEKRPVVGTHSSHDQRRTETPLDSRWVEKRRFRRHVGGRGNYFPKPCLSHRCDVANLYEAVAPTDKVLVRNFRFATLKIIEATIEAALIVERAARNYLIEVRQNFLFIIR